MVQITNGSDNGSAAVVPRPHHKSAVQSEPRAHPSGSASWALSFGKESVRSGDSIPRRMQSWASKLESPE